MMLEKIEHKLRWPQRIILTGRNRPSGKHAYLEKREPVLKKKIKGLWKAWREELNRQDAEFLLQISTVQPYLRDKWLAIAKDWLEQELNPEYEAAIFSAGEAIMDSFNRQRKSAAFNITMTAILNWMRERGGELIKELTAGQTLTINALLQHQVYMGISSPAALARMLKPMIGLLKREALAVANYRAELLSQGLNMERCDSLVEKYADFLLNARTERIARTELCYAFEFGQMESIRQLQESGLISDVMKEWLTAGDEARMCPECEALDGERVALDEEFSAGVTAPPLHPGCRCDLGYSAMRQ
jgi:SPP1 gp7 family putative phage head morphogenesis protein